MSEEYPNELEREKLVRLAKHISIFAKETARDHKTKSGMLTTKVS